MQFDTDLQSIHKDLFLQVRELLLSNDNVVETKKERITTYSYNKKGLYHLRTMSYGVDIGFLKGVQLTDHLGLLIGNRKTVRVLPLKSFNPVIIEHFINETFQLNMTHKVVQL